MKNNFYIAFIYTVILGNIFFSSVSFAQSTKLQPPIVGNIQQNEKSLLLKWWRPYIETPPYFQEIDGYRIYRSDSIKKLGEAIAEIAETNNPEDAKDSKEFLFTDSSVKPNKKYYYRIRSFLNDGTESTDGKRAWGKVTLSSKIKAYKNVKLKTYQNEELGISFKYPATFGKVWENKDFSGELLWTYFENEKGEVSTDLGFGGEDYETLRTCDDLLLNGFYDGDLKPQRCETLSVDTYPVIILAFKRGRMNLPSKEAHFQTKKGVWSFATTKKSLYDDLIKIVKTIKYLE